MSLNENTILKPRTDFDDCYVYGDEIGKYVLFFFVVKIISDNELISHFPNINDKRNQINCLLLYDL
jgi:hypothetical protein